MKKRSYRSYNGLLACVGVGGLFAASQVVGSWFDNMFYVLGPGPTAADHEAFGADLEFGLYILVGSVVLGLIVTAVTERVQSQQTTIWSDLYDIDPQSSEPDQSSVVTF